MTNHVSGIGAIVSEVSYAAPDGPPSKEIWAFGIFAQLEREENILSRIGGDRTDRITITANLSSKVASIDLLLNATAAVATPGGSISYTVSHYLVGSNFTSGTNGDSTAPNLAQAAMEAAVTLKLIELDKTRNPDGKTTVTRCVHTLGASGGTNATFSALIEFPIEIISLPGGGSVIEGTEWLT